MPRKIAIVSILSGLITYLAMAPAPILASGIAANCQGTGRLSALQLGEPFFLPDVSIGATSLCALEQDQWVAVLLVAVNRGAREASVLGLTELRDGAGGSYRSMAEENPGLYATFAERFQAGAVSLTAELGMPIIRETDLIRPGDRAIVLLLFDVPSSAEGLMLAASERL